MSRRMVVTALLPQPDPEPTYPEYEEIRTAAGPKGRFASTVDTERMEEVARRRGGDWCTAVLGRAYHGLRSISTVDGWMLIVADERGLNPPLPARVLEARKKHQEHQELRAQRAKEQQEREQRRWDAALAAAGVEVTVQENTRHAGVRGPLRHAVPKIELVSGRSRKHPARRGLCETPDRANPLRLGEPVSAPANCHRCLAYMEKVRTLDAPAPPTKAEKALLQLIASGVVFTLRPGRTRVPIIFDTSVRSHGVAWGHLGRRVGAAVTKLEAKGWAAVDAEHSTTQAGGFGWRWQLTDAGTAALEG